MPLLTVNDTAPDLTGTCTNAGVGANLTGATVTVLIQRPDKTLLTKTATITDATHGTWTTPWVAGDLNGVGVYAISARVVYSNAERQTFGPDKVYVGPEPT